MAADFLGLAGVAALVAYFLTVALFIAVPLMIAHALYQIGGALRLLAEVHALRDGTAISKPWMAHAQATPIGTMVAWIAFVVIVGIGGLVVAFIQNS